ncbi:unnamed protein product [Rotaria sordida]|uniref:Uncharacterized protein n=1 Tax=Rotaria sordida TaxID=392033 RepID=A0A815FNI0_9BILA|nr:unnamed protein product [Rotaria sordida]CAF1590072.1 unnamed protein product [Rotaria sordida]
MSEDVPDSFRSMLQCIHLAAICYSKYLDNDEKIRKFYDPIVKELNDLQLTGLTINTFNSQLLFSFSAIAADNLAAHNVAGFQQTFSSGNFCRRCLITYENRLIPLTDVHFIQRTYSQHEKCLQLLKNKPHIKFVSGVVGPSPLNDLHNFDPTNSFPGDAMHDFFEGVCPLIIMAMLKEASGLRLITFNGIQNRTENFVYGEFDTSNKPPPILVKNLNNNHIVGSASQKYCLFRLFPIIFSDLVEKLQSFKIYLVLRELLDMILAFPRRKSWLPFMETLAINFQCMMDSSHSRFGQQLAQFDQTLLRFSELIYNHIIYKQYAVYVYDLQHVEDIPLFFQIHYIFKYNQQWIFIVDFLNTDGFSTKLWSYKVSSCDRLGIVSPNDLKYFHKGLDLYEVDQLHLVNLTSRLTKQN